MVGCEIIRKLVVSLRQGCASPSRVRLAFFKARSQTLLSRGAPGTRRKSVSFAQCLSM